MERERLVEDLRRQLSAAQRSGEPAVDSFFGELSRREEDAEALVEFALAVMERFVAEDGYLVADGCRKLLLSRAGPAESGRVRAVRTSLPPLEGALGGRDYRDDWDEVVALAEGRGQGACDCAIRARFSPPPRDPAYAMVAETPDPAVMGYACRVRCRRCGKEWDVEVDLSYHYPHAFWRSA